MTEQPDLPPELLERVVETIKLCRKNAHSYRVKELAKQGLWPESNWWPSEEVIARAVAPLLIAHGRESEKAEVAKRFDHIRSDLNNISRAIEDEGDRCYFGSTNDPDELRRVACDFEDWLLREERNEHRSKPVIIGTRCKLCHTFAPEYFAAECNRPECPHRSKP